MQRADLVQKMKEKAELVQAVVSTVGSFEAACDYAIDLTRTQGRQTLAAPGLTNGEKTCLADRCGAGGMTLIEPPFRTHARDIHTAISRADWGIAETGSLVLDSRSEDLRLATMLAETHVAFLPASRILPDTEALADDLDGILKSDQPSYTAFITGASRTADIERVLAIGVHGPKVLHILIIEDSDP
jgi:L-lactate dehydrogenase complex protein LldG